MGGEESTIDGLQKARPEIDNELPRPKTVLTILFTDVVSLPPILMHHESLTRLRQSWDMPSAGWLPAIFFAVYLLPYTIDRGFTVQWG